MSNYKNMKLLHFSIAGGRFGMVGSLSMNYNWIRTNPDLQNNNKKFDSFVDFARNPKDKIIFFLYIKKELKCHAKKGFLEDLLTSRLYKTLKGVMLWADTSSTFSRISFVFVNFGVSKDFFTLQPSNSWTTMVDCSVTKGQKSDFGKTI